MLAITNIKNKVPKEMPQNTKLAPTFLYAKIDICMIINAIAKITNMTSYDDATIFLHLL